MQLLLHIKNTDVENNVKNQSSQIYDSVTIVKHFADIFIHQSENPEIFICDIGEYNAFIELYHAIKCERHFHIPYCIFVAPQAREYKFYHIYSYEDVISKDFLKNFDFDKVADITSEEQIALFSCLKYYGFSNSSTGTKYFAMICRYLYVFPHRYFHNFEKSYRDIGFLVNKTANAIKKSIQQALDLAMFRRCKGLQELKNDMQINYISVKFLSNFISSQVHKLASSISGN